MEEEDDIQKKFSTTDADARHSGLNARQKAKWTQIANAVERDTGDKVKAIQAANSVINELPKKPSMKVKNKPQK